MLLSSSSRTSATTRPAASETMDAPSSATSFEDPVAQRRAAQKNFRKEALEHVHASDGCDKMLTLRVVREAYLRLTDRVVYVGSREFEEDRRCKFLKKGTRGFRITELSGGGLEDACFFQMQGVLFSVELAHRHCEFDHALPLLDLSRSLCRVCPLLLCSASPRVALFQIFGASVVGHVRVHARLCHGSASSGLSHCRSVGVTRFNCHRRVLRQLRGIRRCFAGVLARGHGGF